MNPVVIVGGGLSGLAAGVHLASRRIPVVVLEQKPAAGGRAYSFTDSVSGETVDNGQHLLIAGYTRTLRFLETIGTINQLMIQPRPCIVFHHPVRGFRELTFPHLLPPFHFLWGMLSCGLFTPGDRLRILRAGRDVQRLSPAREHRIQDLTIRQWLDGLGQSGETLRSFWEPLAVSIMNERMEVASALVFLRSLRTVFLGRWNNAAMVIPRVGLSDLYVHPATEFIRRHGGEVRTGSEVVGLREDGTMVSGVTLRDGTTVGASAVTLAVPPTQIAPLLPARLRESGFASGIAESPVSPIVSVHLWFEREFMRHDVVGLIGKRIQWVFNRRLIAVGAGRAGGHVSAVISAAHVTVPLSVAEIIRCATEDLQQVFGVSAACVTHALVIKEKRATFSLTPEVERHRPDHQSPVANLFLAGDWTATGLPATLEGAIRSGERCAELASRFLAA